MPREREDQDPPLNEEDIDFKAERSREALDSVPEPGTDPLHEGP